MGILKVKELQSSNGDTVLGINDDGTINIASQYNPGNVVLSTWDQTTRPTTGLFPGMLDTIQKKEDLNYSLVLMTEVILFGME